MDWNDDLAAVQGDHENGKGEEEQDQKDPILPDPTAKLFLEANGQLPDDVLAVWGDSPHAAEYIRAWGLEAFRTSKLHQMAVLEAERQQRLMPLRKGFAKQGKKK